MSTIYRLVERLEEIHEQTNARQRAELAAVTAERDAARAEVARLQSLVAALEAQASGTAAAESGYDEMVKIDEKH
jgi:hypothetical protein